VAKTGSKGAEIAVGWRTTLHFHALHCSSISSVPPEKSIMRIILGFLGAHLQKEELRAVESVVQSDVSS